MMSCGDLPTVAGNIVQETDQGKMVSWHSENSSVRWDTTLPCSLDCGDGIHLSVFTRLWRWDTSLPWSLDCG
ncbi:hypothetical protein BsWGS_19801 [Bradybaena similaris]